MAKPRTVLVILAASVAWCTAAAVAQAAPPTDQLVTVGSPPTPFSQNKQNEPAVAIDPAHPSVVVAGANEEIDDESCAAGDPQKKANDQLAKLIGENDFNSLFHQGEKESMYLADVARRVILVVLFDNRTTLGLVRLKMKATVDELAKLFDEVFKRGASDEKPNILAGADDEIDKLFQ